MSHHGIIAVHFCPISVIVVHPVSNDGIITVHLCPIMALLWCIPCPPTVLLCASRVQSWYYYHAFRVR